MSCLFTPLTTIRVPLRWIRARILVVRAYSFAKRNQELKSVYQEDKKYFIKFFLYQNMNIQITSALVFISLAEGKNNLHKSNRSMAKLEQSINCSYKLLTFDIFCHKNFMLLALARIAKILLDHSKMPKGRITFTNFQHSISVFSC